MRNFVPLSLFAVAASLAALGTPSFHADHLASAPSVYSFVPAADINEAVTQPVYAPTLHPNVPRCEPRCLIRGPMT
jgi:hypothetical protein